MLKNGKQKNGAWTNCLVGLPKQFWREKNKLIGQPKCSSKLLGQTAGATRSLGQSAWAAQAVCLSAWAAQALCPRLGSPSSLPK